MVVLIFLSEGLAFLDIFSELSYFFVQVILEVEVI
jgi:hypothetical protein